MAKPYRIPDFKKMYPEASEEVIAVLKTTERKMQYQEYDLKNEQTVIDEENQKVTVIPSREDSYERLAEMAVQFAGEVTSTEAQVLRRMESEQLHKALSFLSDYERYLIRQIYFEELTGMTVHSYLNNKRLMYSCEGLKEGMTIGEVWGKCGFSDYSSFLRNFRKEYGMSPTSYRAYLEKK